MRKDNRKQVGILFSKEEYEILEGLAEAFYKTGTIPKDTVGTLILWNTRKMVTEIMTKRKEQLRKEFELQESKRRELELKKQYPHLYGEQSK